MVGGFGPLLGTCKLLDVCRGGVIGAGDFGFWNRSSSAVGLGSGERSLGSLMVGRTVGPVDGAIGERRGGRETCEDPGLVEDCLWFWSSLCDFVVPLGAGDGLLRRFLESCNATVSSAGLKS